MSDRITPVSWNNLVKRLKSMGFDGPHRSGKHYFMTKAELKLTIPNPHGQDISVDLLKEILDRAGITREEWLKTKK